MKSMRIILHNFRFNRRKGWLLFIISFVILFLIFNLFDIPLKNDRYNTQDLLKFASKRKSEVNFVMRKAENFEKLKSQTDTSKLNEKESNKVLVKVFRKGDSDHNGKLDVKEITKLISGKVKDHIAMAIKENFYIFSAIDRNPRNGAVTWDEYIHYLLKQLGFSPSEIETHTRSLQGLPRDVKEKVVKDKASFNFAAREDPERLSIDEFLSFRHPESSHATILSYVEDTLFRHDINTDGFINEAEFSDPELNEDGLEGASAEKYKKARIKEFRDVLDKDKNGRVDRNELVQYFDPRHIHHAEREAIHLMNAGDLNEDGVLSQAEILINKEMFLGSKLVDVAKSFHDEF